MFTEPCEQVFRAHSRISRCALIALGLPGKQKLAIVVELDIQDSHEARALARELRHLARSHVHTSNINTFFFHPKLPVDIRHNAKIHRLKLAEWAATAKGFESDPKR